MPDTFNFTDCIESKTAKIPTTGKLAEHSGRFTVHTDVCGPLNNSTFRGKSYILMFNVKSSKNICVHLKKILNEVEGHCHNFISRAETSSSLNVRRVQSDNGDKYLDIKDTQRWGNTLTVSTAYNSQSNQLVENVREILSTANTAPLDRG